MSASRVFPFDRQWELSEAITFALLLEASAPKAGNVHPAASFEDTTYAHFVASGVAVGKSLGLTGRDPKIGTGEMILQAVQAMRRAVSGNTVLGSILLFGPLVAASATHRSCEQADVAQVLQEMTPEDSQYVYQAIRSARPGGLGQSSSHDLAGDAPPDLIQAMSQVASFDAVARQYVTDFEDVLSRTVPWLLEFLDQSQDVSDAICRLQLRWLAYEMDGLIVRKCGYDEASRVQARAQTVWEKCQTVSRNIYDRPSYREFDALLRSQSNRLNPGTTADLIAATLLVVLI